MPDQQPLDHQSIFDLMRQVSEEEILPRYRSLAPNDIIEKSPNDLVTVADLASERALTAGLKAIMPHAEAFGEEAYEADRSVIEAVKGDRPVWIIDPIDGTRNFTKGKDCFAIILAMVEAGETRAGFIYDPLTGDAVWAEHGKGAFDGEGRRLPRPSVIDVEDMHGAGGFQMKKKLLVKQQLGAARGLPASMTSFGSTGREYMALAQGQLDFAFYAGRQVKPWDHAAGQLIAREAGYQALLAEARASYRPLDVLDGPSILVAPDLRTWSTLFATFRGFLQ